MPRPACLAVWPGGAVGSKAWGELYDCVLRGHICQRTAPWSVLSTYLPSSPIAARLRFILFLSLREMAQLAWLVHFLVGKADVTLTVSGRPAASTLCVWLDSLMTEKYFWQLTMLYVLCTANLLS